MEEGKFEMIVIVDYGMGNLGSIKNMLKKLDIIENSCKLLYFTN